MKIAFGLNASVLPILSAGTMSAQQFLLLTET